MESWQRTGLFLMALVGIEIGGTKLQIVTGDSSGAISQRFRFNVDRQSGAAGIQKHIESCFNELQRTTRIDAVGVGFGGPVNWKTGQICCSHHIEGWSEFPISTWLQSLTKAPVAVDNDANVAAFGEALRGAGKDKNVVFYVTLGSGVGGGLVVDKQIYHGASPGESEIGHVRLDKSGRIVESSCSGWAVDRKIRSAIGQFPASSLARLAKNVSGGEARCLDAALQENDAVAKEILFNTAEDLAFGLSHVIPLFHPEIIVIGGGLSLLGEPLRVAVERYIPRFLMDAFLPGPTVALAGLREDAVPIGALALAQRVLPS